MALSKKKKMTREDVILPPVITVVGVGGAGGNAVDNMIEANLKDVNFVVANTDAQALDKSKSEVRIQLGAKSTKGLGAGADPDLGETAALESEEAIKSKIEGSSMLFITAGMGGGTGTGAAPVVARIAKELGILTVAVVTKPFDFEGQRRRNVALLGLDELQKNVDTLIVIPNQNLFHVVSESTSFTSAFAMADEVLHSGVRGITDLITMPGLINLDFADIKNVMTEMGKAMIGTGEAEGENRAIKAAELAIVNPLLDHNSMHGAKAVLINITGGRDMTLTEVNEATNRIRKEVGDDNANIIFGAALDMNLEGRIKVFFAATGIDVENVNDQHSMQDRFSMHSNKAPYKSKYGLDDNNRANNVLGSGYNSKLANSVSANNASSKTGYENINKTTIYDDKQAYFKNELDSVPNFREYEHMSSDDETSNKKLDESKSDLKNDHDYQTSADLTNSDLNESNNDLVAAQRGNNATHNSNKSLFGRIVSLFNGDSEEKDLHNSVRKQNVGKQHKTNDQKVQDVPFSDD